MAQSAEAFLKNHYCTDDLDSDQVRRDCEHWEWVMGDAGRFPNADLDFIDHFTEAAFEWLAAGGCGTQTNPEAGSRAVYSPASAAA